MNAHRTHRWMKTPSGLYGLNIWTRLVCDSLCVCARVMASPDVEQFPEAWLLIRGAAQGHAAPLMLTLHALYFFWDSHYSCRTRSRPRSNGKNTCGSFPGKKQNYPRSPRAGPAGAEPGLTDGLAVTHIFVLLSFSTHTCREIRAARGLSWPNRLCGFPFDVCRADPDHNIQQKSHQQPVDGSVTRLCVCLWQFHISGARQRPPTCFLTIFASLGTNFPTADWPELSLNPELSSSKAPTDCTKWTD